MGVKAWITVNGNHIPIMDGESKMDAVGRFIKERRDKKLKNAKDNIEYNRQARNNAIVNKEAADMRVIHPKDYNKLRKETLAKLQESNQQYNNEVRGLKKKLKGRQLTQEGYAKKLQDLNDKYRSLERREGYNLTEWANSRYKDDGYRNNAIVYRAELKNIEKEYHMVKDKMNASKQKGTYKLKEDRIKKTPVSSINVDTTSFRGTHGKEPGSLRVGGSSRGNWAFKLGNETIFINDTYSNAKKQALKEASRRGLWSIKVLG